MGKSTNQPVDIHLLAPLNPEKRAPSAGSRVAPAADRMWAEPQEFISIKQAAQPVANGRLESHQGS